MAKPSHAATGPTLQLAELRPDRADTILKRGRDFGESRVICDQEWQSDIEAGRTVEAAIDRLAQSLLF